MRPVLLPAWLDNPWVNRVFAVLLGLAFACLLLAFFGVLKP